MIPAASCQHRAMQAPWLPTCLPELEVSSPTQKPKRKMQPIQPGRTLDRPASQQFPTHGEHGWIWSECVTAVSPADASSCPSHCLLPSFLLSFVRGGENNQHFQPTHGISHGIIPLAKSCLTVKLANILPET